MPQKFEFLFKYYATFEIETKTPGNSNIGGISESFVVTRRLNLLFRGGLEFLGQTCYICSSFSTILLDVLFIGFLLVH